MQDVMSVLSDHDFIASVVEHSKRTFGNGWRKLDEGTPGFFRLMPGDLLKKHLVPDYEKMSGMIFGDPPPLDLVFDRIGVIEATLNGV